MESPDWRFGVRTSVDRTKAKVTEVFIFNLVTKEEINLNHILTDASLGISPRGTLLACTFLAPYSFDNKEPVEIIRPG